MAKITQQEWEQEQASLIRDFERKKAALIERIALTNNELNIGDTVTDHIGSIRIEKIRPANTYGSTMPICIYYGPELRKDGTPKLNGAKRDLYQSNISK